MAENENSLFFGRKIFFLHPPLLIRNYLIKELGQDEFEVYIARNESSLRQVLAKFNNSIVFACINEGMRENEWDDWIRGIAGGQGYSGVDIGIVISIADEIVMRKYLENARVRCGVTVLNADTGGIKNRFISILNSVNAKGRRKYIRALFDNAADASVNFPMNGTYVSAAIKDISAAGFSCSFRDDTELSKNSVFKDIQIRLQNQIIRADGIIFGSRNDGAEKSYVVLFDQYMDNETRTKIRQFIQSVLQKIMDNELK